MGFLFCIFVVFHTSKVGTSRHHVLSKFCTSKVGTLKFHFVAEKAVKSRRSSTNFNCKVSSVDGLSLNNLCGLESGRVNLKKQTLAFKLTLSATGLPQILEPVSQAPLVWDLCEKSFIRGPRGHCNS